MKAQRPFGFLVLSLLRTMFEKRFETIVIITLLLTSSLRISTPSAATGGQDLGSPSISAAPKPAYADWSQAGYPGEIPYPTDTVINVKDAGATGNGATDDHAAIQAAINGAPNPAVIFFPAGVYRIESVLNLKSGIVLRGEGYKLTRIECRCSSGCIRMRGGSGSYVSILGGLEKGSNQITVSDASAFTVGRGGQIRQEDIVTPEAPSWGAYAVGQMVKILAIDGDTLTIDPPLHIDYSASKNPEIRPVNYIEQVGIEDLHLKRLDSGSTGGHNFDIRFAADSWIRRVESEWTEKYHIAVSESLHLEIRDSYIHDAKTRASGGYGYGVSLARTVTSVLVENNIFYDLRHSMIIQIGTNGCVFGYNYAERNYSDDDGGWAKTYISLHGHYPFMNLFEGNIVGWIGIGDWWGPIGPGNTFFRNRALGTDRYDGFGDHHGIMVEYIHGPQYIVGNEVTGGDLYFVIGPRTHPDVDYAVEHEKVVVHGNNVKGTVTWDPTIPDRTLPDSYYLPSKPRFYGEMAWPSIGGDKTIGEGKIPALVRWEEGNYIPASSHPVLHGAPADEAIRLTWAVDGALPATATWRIDYYSQTVPAVVSHTGIASATRAYTLTELTNYAWYTVTLSTVDTTPILSDTVRVMPTDRLVYLPLVFRSP